MAKKPRNTKARTSSVDVALGDQRGAGPTPDGAPPSALLPQLVTEIRILRENYGWAFWALASAVFAFLAVGVVCTLFLKNYLFASAPAGPSLVTYEPDRTERMPQQEIQQLRAAMDRANLNIEALSLRVDRSLEVTLRNFRNALNEQSDEAVRNFDRRLTQVYVEPALDGAHESFLVKLKTKKFDVQTGSPYVHSNARGKESQVPAGDSVLVLSQHLKPQYAYDLIRETIDYPGLVSLDIVTCPESVGMDEYANGVGVPWSEWGVWRKLKRLTKAEWGDALDKAREGNGSLHNWIYPSADDEVCARPTPTLTPTLSPASTPTRGAGGG